MKKRMSKRESNPENIQVDVLNLLKPLKLTKKNYESIMNKLHDEMEKGLKASTNKTASVKMYPSYVTKLPTGKEKGDVIALDLGGTNFRTLLVKLKGDGDPAIFETAYTIPNAKMTGNGEELFDYIAEVLQEFLKSHEVKDTKPLPLGFTFSFPCEQKGLASSVLTSWTKGFSATGVVGNDVAQLLQTALDKRSIKAKCVAVVNDTVGTLTSCALKDPKCAIGLIVGTGSNAAYVEDASKVELYNGPKPDSGFVVINMEWGAFGDNGELDEFMTPFDNLLDKQSLRPGKQRYEKLISGLYLGEIVRLILLQLIEKKYIFHGNLPASLKERGSFLTKYITETERDPPGLFYSTNYMLTEDLKVPVVEPEDSCIVRYVCETVGARAAYMAGAGIACLLNRLNRDEVTVGIDGSLFKFHPKFPERMIDMIHHLKKDNSRFVLRLSEDGSGKGAAAIAAAVN